MGGSSLCVPLCTIPPRKLTARSLLAFVAGALLLRSSLSWTHGRSTNLGLTRSALSILHYSQARACNPTDSRPQMSARRIFLWFRTDLRLLDNYIVAEAATLVSSNAKCDVVPVYFFDPRHFSHSRYGPLKTGVLRAQFLLEAVSNLKRRLRDVGSDLLVFHGRPEEVFQQELLSDETCEVLTQEEATDEEMHVDNKLQEVLVLRNSSLRKIWGSTLYHKDDLPMAVSGMQDVFTPWKDEVEDKSSIRTCVPAPRPGDLGCIPEHLFKFTQAELPSLQALGFSATEIEALKHPDARGVLAFRGGEDAALERVGEYIWKRDCLKEYFDTRNGMIGADYSTKFSPWLALGCVSPRYIHFEAQRYERERVKNKSTYWLTWELTCRDFYRFKCLKHGNAVFKRSGIAGVDKEWLGEGEEARRWREGCTGVPLVDANMRELRRTGFMSNRGRQNVASYLNQDLGVDWRLGAAWFEEQLVDHDVCSNWANWCAAGGVAGGRVNRFNMVKQSGDYDPDGAYCRLWLPELRGVPGAKVHQPWLLTAEEQQEYGVRISATEESTGGGGGESGEAVQATSWYPLPMVPPPSAPDPNVERKRKKKK